jgi:transposase
VINAILWKLRTGAPWRDLPERYGPWKTAHERLRFWTADGTWQRVLDEVIVKDDSVGDLEWVISVDSSVVRAHQHAAGARKKGAAPPRSRRSRSREKELDELDARAARAPPQHVLTELGVTRLDTELFTWWTPVDGFEPLWSMLTGPGIWQPAVSTLDADTAAELRHQYAFRLRDYATANGTYLIPSTCRLLWGRT